MTVENRELKVVGERTIHCEGCARMIEHGLSRIPGVLHVSHSAKTQRIRHVLDDQQVSPASFG